MSTFAEIRRKTHAMSKKIAEYTGLEEFFVLNIITYAKQLCTAENPEVIDEIVFVAQMCMRFGITSRFHVELMFESLHTKNTKYVKLEDYARTVAVFFSPILDVQIDFVFSVYDFKQDGVLEVSEITSLLSTSIIHAGEDNDPIEILNDLVSLVLNVTDTNNDNVISVEEFRTFVKRDILCIQLFGSVLPSEGVLKVFKKLLTTSSPQEISEYFQGERAKCLQEPVTEAKEDPLFPGVALDFS